MQQFDKVICDNPGNYMISLDGEPHYIGEAKNLAARLKQQFKTKTSTFFKNYLKTEPDHPSEIVDFQVQYMETSFGRKEIEDFGVVNIPTKLNRFQLDKRKRIPPAADGAWWAEIQACSREIIVEGEAEFFTQLLSPMLEAPVPHCAGLYSVWTDNRDKPIYIGESSDIGKRHKTHCQQTYFSALRRHVGTEILGYSLKNIKGRKRYFPESEDRMVTNYLSSCLFSFMPVALGRIEIEEYLIRKHRPLLNRKGNKPVSVGT